MGVPSVMPNFSVILEKLREAANKANPANNPPQTTGSTTPPYATTDPTDSDNSTLSAAAQQAQQQAQLSKLIANLLQVHNAGQSTADLWKQLAKLGQATGVPGVSGYGPGVTASQNGNSITVTGPGGATITFQKGSTPHQAIGVPVGTEKSVGNGDYTLPDGSPLKIENLPEGQNLLYNVPLKSVGTGASPASGAAPAPQAGGTGAPQTATSGMSYTPPSN